MVSLCFYNWRIFLIKKEVSKVNSYNTRRSYIANPHLHKTALFPAPTTLVFLCTHSPPPPLSLSVAHITCKKTMDLIWASVYSVI